MSLPPLRERKDDIPLLAEHFISQFCDENDSPLCTLDQGALRVLMEYNWPGNVRELENVMERSVVLASEERILREDLFPQELLESTSMNIRQLDLGKNGTSLKDLVLEFEKNLIITALKKTEWNQKNAAALLRVNPTTLHEKLKRMKIKGPQSG